MSSRGGGERAAPLRLPRSLPALAEVVVACERCPRLVAHRAQVGEAKRRAYREETYWSRPVPGFGDPSASLVVLGLAPGAHGANRTGRVFTGDRSGDFLYAALHRAGLASQPTATHAADGLALRGVWITLPCRCVPPDNRPSPAELERCRPFLARELALLASARALLALGAIALGSLDAVARGPSRRAFAHGAESVVELPDGRALAVVSSYHVSQQNTQTGRLTPAMFDRVLLRACELAGLRAPASA